MYQFSSVQFSHSVVSDSLRPHELQHARPPCPAPTPGVHSKSRPSSWWCHPAISSSVVPFSSCLQPFPASEPFPMSYYVYQRHLKSNIQHLNPIFHRDFWNTLGKACWEFANTESMNNDERLVSMYCQYLKGSQDKNRSTHSREEPGHEALSSLTARNYPEVSDYVQRCSPKSCLWYNGLLCFWIIIKWVFVNINMKSSSWNAVKWKYSQTIHITKFINNMFVWINTFRVCCVRQTYPVHLLLVVSHWVLSSSLLPHGL